jgi:hypothetical protein
LQDHRVARGADTWIDHREENRAGWKSALQSVEQMRTRAYAKPRHALQQIDDDRARRQMLEQGRLELAHVDVVGAEVGNSTIIEGMAAIVGS